MVFRKGGSPELKERAILHSDANSFYASVETVLNPELRGKAMAVCGNREDRHGIVLAKSEKAKKAGVKTGMAILEAQRCCPNLIIAPPQYDYYLKFSKLLFKIYQRYTDLIEPFGMDECWLDVTDSIGTPMEIAEEIRKSVKDELGITVSIGVSFNKIFAKLGSDMKKPDAITEITRENFQTKVWSLPCSDLLYCGRATTAKLNRWNVITIGNLANFPPELLKNKLGKNGIMLWKFANGFDNSRVAHMDYVTPAKSVGHGITCVSDIENAQEAKKVIYALSQDIGYKLRFMNLKAAGVHLYVRDNGLLSVGWQAQLDIPTYDENAIADKAFEIFTEKYKWNKAVRALTVSAIRLVPSTLSIQTTVFCNMDKIDKRERLCQSIDDIKNRFGKKAVIPALILNENKMPKHSDKTVIMPGYMYQ